MKDKQLLLVSFFILLVVALGLLIGILQRPVCPVAAMDLPAPTSVPILTPAPTGSLDQAEPKAAVVETVEAKETTYTYRLDEYGHAIWSAAGEITAGELVKRSACLGDGFAQVEYRDPSRPTRWLVQFVKCGR